MKNRDYLKRRYRVIAFIKEVLAAAVIAFTILALVVLTWWKCV